MTSAVIFYTNLFFVLIAFPAGLILVALLFFEHERLLWKRMKPLIGPMGRLLARSPGVMAMRSRFPRAAGFLIHCLDPRDPWGLPAALAGIVMFAGLRFFLGVLQDIVAKDPLVILDIRLHNAVPIFRTAGMTRTMLAITELGGVRFYRFCAWALHCLRRPRDTVGSRPRLCSPTRSGCRSALAPAGLPVPVRW